MLRNGNGSKDISVDLSNIKVILIYNIMMRLKDFFLMAFEKDDNNNIEND